MDYSLSCRMTAWLFAALLSVSPAIGNTDNLEFPLTAAYLPHYQTLKEFQDVRKRFNLETIPASGRHTLHSPLKGAPAIRGQLDTIYRPTEILDKDWQEFESSWMNTMMLTMAYDGEGREVERTGRIWMLNAWENQFNILFTYDASGRVTRVIGRAWDGGLWQTGSRDTVIYNIYGNPIEERIEIFNGSSWIPFQRFLVSYDGSQRPSDIVGQNWTLTDWVNSFKYTLTYDGDGRIAEFLNQSWSGGGWTNNLCEKYSYDTNGNRTEEVDQFWAGGEWNNDIRYTWTFDVSEFLVEVLSENWKTSAWVNDVRDVYNNDTEGLPGDILTQYWDGFSWLDDKIVYISYDAGNIVEEYYQSWNVSEWVNFHITSYVWQAFVVTADVTQYYDVSDKWNMVSVPLDVPDHSKNVLFPTSVSNAFAYDAGYVASPMLENGKGYWLKFDGLQTVSVTGGLLTEDTVDVVAGWNMVGSIGVSITAASVGSIPGGLVSSAFFGFSNGYSASTNIDPGKGYWVKMAEAGKLVFSSAGNMPVASSLRMELEDAMPPAPPGGETTDADVPDGFRLEQNYPNPFNPLTRVNYSLPADEHVRLSVFNSLGQEVMVLLDEVRPAGDHSVAIHAGSLASGTYTYKLTAGSYTVSRRMLLIR